MYLVQLVEVLAAISVLLLASMLEIKTNATRIHLDSINVINRIKVNRYNVPIITQVTQRVP